MRNFLQLIGYVFILALFLGSGPNGACSIWSVAGIDHDHHEGQEAMVVFEELGHCKQPSVPCNDANEELPDLQFPIPVDSQKQFSVSLVATMPVPVVEFSASLFETYFQPLIYYESARLSFVSRRLAYCRFLI